MIPAACPNPKLQEVQEWLNATPNAAELLQDLTAEDAALFGSYVIFYSGIELNMRRSLEIFATAGKLTEAENKKRHEMNMGKVVKTIERVICSLEPVMTQDYHKTFGDIEYGRSVRNLIAHWAPRRVPDQDIYVFFTRSAFDVKQATGGELGVNYVANAVLESPRLRSFLPTVQILQGWLAYKTVEWYTTYMPLDKQAM